jgi:photosystem II stability/assembly factor-like uncharacterized protein
VNDVTVPPEGTNLLWKGVGIPGRQRIDCIAVDPDERIFLGVYDYNWDFGHTVSAVHISTDNGETWVKKQVGPFEIVNLAIDSEGRIFAESYDRIMRSRDHGETWEVLSFRLNSQGSLRLVVASGDNLYLRTSYSGIYFSDDHGDSWTQIGDGIRGAGELTSLAVNSKGCLFAIAGRTLHKSCDRGASWTEPPGVPEGSLRWQVAIDSLDRIFVNARFSFYRSTDDGETWTVLRPMQEPANAISIDGQDRLFSLGQSSVYVSDDGGDNWALLLSLWNQPRQVASYAAGDIFVIGKWGMSRTLDGGANWEMLGFSEYQLADMAIERNGVCYLGLACGGIYRSIDSLKSWGRFNKGLPDVELTCLASANDSVLIAGTRNGIYISPKDRPAWSLAGVPLHGVQKVFPLSGDSVAAFTNSLFVSADGGNTWNDIGLEGYVVRALVRTDDGSLLAGANFGGVFRYTGEGILWDQMNVGLGDLRVNALAVTGSGDVLAGTDKGVFISSDDGVSWRGFSTAQIPVASVLVVGEDIFFVTGTGILWTRTGGSALSPQNEGLQGPDLSTIISIAADPDDYLFLFTPRNVYRSSQSTKELTPAGL